MADNYYPMPDTDDDKASPSHGDNAMGDEPEAKGGDEEQMEGETALLPNSILGGKEFQPGEEIVLKIVKMHGDQVEVAYASKDENSNAMPEGKEMGAAMGKLGGMGSEE